MSARTDGRTDEGESQDAPKRPRAKFDATVSVDRQSQARSVVDESPETIAVVVRGEPRSVIFACPCGCGDVLVINLDRAVGPAWRLRRDSDGLSLFPSVWRTSGCRSHFVVWRSRVWWCRWDDEKADTEVEEQAEWPFAMDEELRDEWRRIRAAAAARRHP